MKKIFVFLLFFISLKSFGQYPNGIQTLGNDSNVVQPKGGLKARLINFVYTDTTAANLQRIKQYPGAQIFTTSDNKFWLRDATASYWIVQGAGSGVDSATIYNYINNIYNYLTADTAYLNQFMPAGTYVTSAEIIQDSILRVCYRSLTVSDSCVDDTLHNSNISFITNLIDNRIIYQDSAGRDTTFIMGPTANGADVLYSTTNLLNDNDTLHLRLLNNNAALDSQINVNASGNVIMELKTAPGSILDTTFQWSVLDSLSTPSGGAVSGDIYLVGTSPTGAFVGQANNIATYDGAAYSFQTPNVGDLLYNGTTDFVSKWTGTVWRRIGRATIHQGGDRYAATIAIGSNDNRQLNLKTNNTARLIIANNGDATFTKLTGTGLAIMGLSATGLTSRIDTGRNVSQLATGGSLNKVRDSLQANINLKLNISDTTNKWVQTVASNAAGDSLIVTKNGVRSAYAYPAGGSGDVVDSIRLKDSFKDSVVLYKNNDGGTFQFRTAQYFNVLDYGAIADGVTDCTVAFQLAINDAIAAGGGTIYIPYATKPYIIAGALQTSISGTNPNSQLYIPLVAISGQLVFIKFLGGTNPNVLTPGFAGGAVARNQQGVILESTINGTGTVPSVFSTPWQFYTGWGYRNGVYVTMENMVIRTRTKTLAGVDTIGTMSAVNFSKLGNFSTTNVKADISSILLNMVQPTAETYGFIFPNLNNGNVNANYGLLMIEGYEYGLVLPEHGAFQNVVTVGVDKGIVIDSMYHSATIQSYCPENVIKNIYMRGNGQLDITSMSTEHYTTGWWANTHDVYFENPPVASGILIYPPNLAYISKRRVHIANYTQVSPSVGDSIKFVTNDSTNVFVDHFNNVSAVESIQYPTAAATQNINLLIGNQIHLNLTANTAVNLSNSFFGRQVSIFAKQDATGGWTLTVAGTSITIDAAANAYTKVTGTNTALGWIFSTSSSGGGVSTGWSITGNTGIIANTNFLGTTDAQKIYGKTNGAIRFLVDSVANLFLIDSVPAPWRGAIAAPLSAARNRNMFAGDSSGYKYLPTGSTVGQFNTAFGIRALARDSAGNNNTAFGYEALWKNKNATGGNSAFGSTALTNNTTGTNNMAIGANALTANTTASNNVAIGVSAMAANTTGGTNVGVGTSALASNTTGALNTAVGYEALLTNTTSGFQTAVGYRALRVATGERNTAVGSGAFQAKTTGFSNVAIGESAAYQMTTGDKNVRIGAEYNNSLGITSGTGRNTIIGADILSHSATLNNTIIISDGDGQQSYLTNQYRKTGIRNTYPTSGLNLAYGTKAVWGAPLKIPYFFQATTAASGTGAVSTLTFAAQQVVPFSIGDTILVVGVTPTGYNGTWRVTAATTTTVSYSNSTTGSQTVAGTVEAGFMPTVPENGAFGRDSTNIKVQLGQNANLLEYFLTKTLTATATLDFASTLAGAVSDLTLTVTGAVDGDAVTIGVPNASYPATGTFTAWVSAANTVTIRYANNSLTLAQDPASGTFRASVIRY